MVEKGKPDPQALYLAFKEMGIQAHDAVYVGDARSDYLAAQSAGCTFVYYLRDPADADPQIPGQIRRIARHDEILSLLDR
jgi:phosphoglycolate phosphatase-like HAD superfamily hydrolase